MRDGNGKVRYTAHVLLVLFLLIAAGIAEAAAYFHYEEWSQQPPVLLNFCELDPVYNMDGSWFHGWLGIGYMPWLLILEHILTLLAGVFMYRFINVISRFYKLSGFGAYFWDFGTTVALYRLITVMRGSRTLDYLHIKGSGTYDLVDMFIGICLLGMLLWIIVYIPVSCRYKKEKTAGMKQWQKFLWECRLTCALIQATVSSKEKQRTIFTKWGVNE